MTAGTASRPTTVSLGDFVASLRLADIPAEVVEKLKCNLLHDLACSLAAHSVGGPAWALAAGTAPAESTLFCVGGRVPAEQAAFANAVVMHGRAG